VIDQCPVHPHLFIKHRQLYLCVTLGFWQLLVACRTRTTALIPRSERLPLHFRISGGN
jgi:hypothetical protein